MPVFILSQVTSKIVGFDQVRAEGHTGENEITDHPVETGSDITDHIRPKSAGLTLDVFVSRTPIARDQIRHRGEIAPITLDVPTFKLPFDGTPGAIFRKLGELGSFVVDAITGAQASPSTDVNVLFFEVDFDPVRETYEDLEAMRVNAVLLTVITSIRTYEDMAIESLGTPIDAPGGASFSISFKHIITVTSGTVKAPKPIEKRGAPAQAKGSQATKPADAAKKASALLQGVNAAVAGVKSLTGP